MFVRILTTILFVAFASSNSWAAKVHGVLKVVKGKVQITSGKSGKIKKAKVGKKVYPGDTIITAKNARVKIVMVDKNVLNISPNSKMTLAKYEYNPSSNKKNVLLNVIYGKVRSKVNQKYNGKSNKFQVKTPSAVAGVRGTDFLASFDRRSLKTNIITFEGRVAFGLPGANGAIRNQVQVAVGQMASAAQGSAPSPPIKVAAKDIMKFDRSSDADKAAPNEPDPRMPSSSEPKTKEKDNKKEPKGKKGPGPKAVAPGADAPNGPNVNNDNEPRKRPENNMAPPGDMGMIDTNMDIIGGVHEGRGPASDGMNPDTAGCFGPFCGGDFDRPPEDFDPNAGIRPPEECQFCREAVEGRTNVIIRVTH